MKIKQKNRTFMELTSSKRKDLYILLKNEIRKEQKEKGANFLSHSVYNGKNCWDDIYFLGAKNGIFYNVTIETLKSSWHEMIDNIAFDRMYRKEGKYESKLLDQYTKELVEEKSFFVYEEAQKAMNYSYGIGLHVAVNEEYLTIENINKFIDNFLKNGEKSYRLEKPYSFPFEKNVDFFVNQLTI